jgi:ABC-type nitrate/sulfonate/bicarbonate transport system substrate-binding protein
MPKTMRTLAAGGCLVLAVAACGSSSATSTSATSVAGSVDAATSKGTITVAAPECAHCLAMSLLGSQVSGYHIKFEALGTLTDLTASLASGAINVAQIDYTGLVSFVSKGIPLVAISGEVNGGSDFVLAPKLGIAAGDWSALEALVAKDKAAGHRLEIASQFGSVQDIELRLELPKYGINPNSDVDFVNVPYQGMAQALNNGSVQAAVPVQPFAASITIGGYGKHFAYPYNQAAVSLTNVVVVTKSYLASHPSQVAAIATGMTKLVPYLKTPTGQSAWAAVVSKYTSLNEPTVTAALTQLTPDITMPFSQIQAIAAAMYEQKLIAAPLSAATLKAAVDYTPLVNASGKTAQSFGASS